MNNTNNAEYEKLCLDLIKENEHQKEIIDKAKEKLKQGITFCENDSQGAYDICNIAINREKEILQILEDKEV